MSEVSVGELFVRLIVSLGVVVGIMAAAAWMLKRVGTGAGALGRAGTAKRVRIEVLARQQLGRRSSVAVVRTGTRNLVLGITDQHVTLLADAPVDELVVPEEVAPRTVSPVDGPTAVASPWRNLTETLRERTVRRS